MAKKKKFKESITTKRTFRVSWERGFEDFDNQRDALGLIEYLQDFVSVDYNVYDQDTVHFKSE